MSGSRDPDRRAATVPPAADGQRLDRFLADHFPLYSRRQLANAVRAGLVRVNSVVARPGTTLAAGDYLELPVWSKVLPDLERERAASRELGRVPTEVEELYRDDELLVVSKPAGVPVHGGARTAPGNTLIDLLREDVLAGFGLVHRLDKDTTGAIALVRGETLRGEAVARFADPAGGVEKVYEAIVSGVPEAPEGVIEAPLTPPGHRGRARVDEDEGKAARTRYRIQETFVRSARLEVVPETGRTHQIRVHLASIGHPLLVDPLYARRKGWRIPDPRGQRDAHLRRTPLHARRLTLPHPRTGRTVTVEAPVPSDMKHALEILRIATARGRKRGGLPPESSEEGSGA
jgi:23S rRNA pseudouridine1911/1915/1917 synthase